jgi:hypothetical protein
MSSRSRAYRLARRRNRLLARVVLAAWVALSLAAIWVALPASSGINGV